MAKQSIKGINMTIRKDAITGVYTASHTTEDGRCITCQALTAVKAMVKVYKAVAKGFL